MPVKLSIVIMGHPKRRLNQRFMQDSLRKEDPAIIVPVSLDHESRGAWWNAQQCWNMVPAGATHHIVMNDDLLLCRDFIKAATNALTAKPDVPVAFFSVYKAILDAKAKGGAWAVTSKMWGACACLPVGMIKDWFEWCDREVKPDFKHDDARLSAYLIANNIGVWNTAPSLAEHIGKTSLMGNHPPIDRTARWFAGNDDNANIDWTKGIENPPRSPKVSLKEYKSILKRPQ